MRRISDLIGSRLRLLAAAAAGAIALTGCANLPADDASQDATAPGNASATTRPPETSQPPRATQGAPSTAAPLPSASTGKPTRTVTLPPTGRVSLSEYRMQMRNQLMKSENASADVADCAAHASWVVPRSATYDALKIPTGALGADRASVEKWEGRFSPGKQAVPVSSVVTFQATAHKRKAQGDWEPVKVRCGYDDGMMLAYELLDGSGAIIAEPAAAPAVPRPAAASKSKKKSKATAGSRSSSTAKSSTRSSAKPKATTSKSSTSSKKKTN